MRNLILFLVKYNAFFLFIILEIISFSLIVRNGTDSQKTILFSSANNFTGYYTEKYNNMLQYWNLPDENEKLARENAQLKAKLRRDKFNHEVDTIMAFDSIYEQQYEYIPALVINNSVNLQNNYITLNRGNKHDVQRNAGVISTDGIVGIVRNTSYRYSTVLSLLHREMKISAMIKRNSYYGSLVWNDNNPSNMTLEAIPK